MNNSNDESRASVFNHYQVNLAASRAAAQFGHLGNVIGSCSQLPDQEEEEIEESIHEECIDESQTHQLTEEAKEEDAELSNEYNVMNK